MTMKTRLLFTIIFMFVCVGTISAQATDITNMSDAIYIQKASAKPGEQVLLSVRLKNQSVTVRGYQFDLYLPEGFSFVKDKDGFYQATMSTSRTTVKKMNYFDSDLQRDGSLRVLCSSTNGSTLDGTEGEVCTIMVEVPSSAELKDYILQVRDAVLTDQDAVRYTLDDVSSVFTLSDCSSMKADMNNDGKIDVVDVMLIVDYILNSP